MNIDCIRYWIETCTDYNRYLVTLVLQSDDYNRYYTIRDYRRRDEVYDVLIMTTPIIP